MAEHTLPERRPPRHITPEQADFRDLVVRESRGDATQEEQLLLRSPELIDKWIAELNSIKREIETQFSERGAEAQEKQNECWKLGREGKAAWFEFKAEHNRWRARAARVKRSLDERVTEAKQLKRAYAQDETDRYNLQRNALNAALCFLQVDANIEESAYEARDRLAAHIEEVYGTPNREDRHGA
jgi:hypothetical protein